MNNLVRRIFNFYGFVTGGRFTSSSEYWQKRYQNRGNSGAGSYGRLAHFKASVLNKLVEEYGVDSVLELGCGDGAQLTLGAYPSYLGVDISPAAIDGCRARFADDPSKSFISLEEFRQTRPTADLALSLDVIYHLVEDQVFDEYMRDLFGASRRLVAIYSSNTNAIPDPAPHVRHRVFSDWIARHATDWRLVATHQNPYPYSWSDRKNTSPCDLFVFEKRTDGDRVAAGMVP